MGTSDDRSSLLGEFKAFMEFQQNLWSILAGVSVLFPLSNVLTQVIPLARWGEPEGGLIYLSPQLVTAISTLGCFFVILQTFGMRRRAASQRNRRATQRQASISFALGAAALIVYLVVYLAAKGNFYFAAFGWQSGDLRRALGDIVLLLAYSGFFMLATRAFMLLGLVEYFGQKERAA